MIVTSKVYKNNQTSIPSSIRKKFNIDENSLIDWTINENGKIELNFRKKLKFEDVKGICKTNEITNAVKLKRSLYK